MSFEVTVRRMQPRVRLLRHRAVRRALASIPGSDIEILDLFTARWHIQDRSEPLLACVQTRYILAIRAVTVRECPGLDELVAEHSYPDCRSFARLHRVFLRRHGDRLDMRPPGGLPTPETSEDEQDESP